MPLLERYKWFQKGIVKTGTTEKMQMFFKTKPTEEQLMILDQIDKDNAILLIFVLLMFLFLGMILYTAFDFFLKSMTI